MPPTGSFDPGGQNCKMAAGETFALPAGGFALSFWTRYLFGAAMTMTGTDTAEEGVEPGKQLHPPPYP